jgi:predicted DNA-binding helix-hairpin-helix protein
VCHPPQAHHLQTRRAATTFVSLQREKRVDGLFLSSGIVPDANTTMEKMLATVERLRLREGYTGYIHLKLIPGASFEYIERAVELAVRVSLNLEAPNQARLSDLAPDKEFAGFLVSTLSPARWSTRTGTVATVVVLTGITPRCRIEHFDAKASTTCGRV